MAYNMYKQIGKIRESLKNKSYEKNIPTEVFCKEFMLMFGMKQKTAVGWMHTFEMVNLIKIDDVNDVVNFA